MAELTAASAASGPGAPAGPRGDVGASTSTNNDARLQLVGPALKGKTKWLGAALVDGTLMGIPGHATSILRIDPRLDRVSVLGEGCVNKRGVNRFKWLRGVAVGASAYGIPMHGDAVLKATPRVDVSKVELLGRKELRRTSGDFKWHGGQLAPNGKIYGVPCYADAVLKIDPARGDAVSVFGDLPAGPAKWYGGILGDDGNMYCVPFNASRVLRVVTAEDRAELIGPELEGQHKWHGGVLGPDGCVYGFPAHAGSVLRVDAATGDVALLPLPEEEQFNGGKYKWGGGCVANGCVYAVPSDASRVLKVDCATGAVSLFGDLPRRRNKWQGGVLGGDGRIWCVPCDADAALVIDPASDACALVGSLPPGPDKYQGGYADHDGNVWCVPEDAKRVLKMNAVSCDHFVAAYLARLGLDAAPPPPTRATLDLLIEAQLERIPFENLDLLLPGSRRTPLAPLALRAKILTRRRGGHCLELNGLFSEFLTRLGFECKLLPCRVYAGPERGRGDAGFRHVPSHAAVVARVPGGDAYFVDVGLGEPPLAAVPFAPSGDAVETPEGMASRVVAVDDDWELQWRRGGAWAPRLRWAAAHGAWEHHGPSLAEFEAEAARYARQPMGRKFVCSNVTRHRKTTISNASLKVTAPRFGPGVVVDVVDLGSEEDVRRALEAHFGVPYAETAGLDVAAGAGEDWWSHL